MSHRKLASLVVVILAAAGGFVACSEDAPVAPVDMHQMTADVAPAGLEPFTFRAPLDPYHIQQLPDFMIHSQARTDIVIQRIVLSATSPFGMWHTHPGPSFVYVIEGAVKVERFTKTEGCIEDPVVGSGNAYFEVADQVHRAIVTSDQPAVLLVTRFNIPVGAAFTIPAADPGC
jgi:Cupin domain